MNGGAPSGHVSRARVEARASRAWTVHALAQLRQEAARSADTHLLRLELPGFPGIAFYFKDDLLWAFALQQSSEPVCR